MRKKRKEEAVCRFLKTLGYVEVTKSIGDAEPPIGSFIREKVITYTCHLESAWAGKTSAHIDFILRLTSHPGILIFLECDEFQHKTGHSKHNATGYSCDHTRITAVMAALVTGSDITSAATAAAPAAASAVGAASPTTSGFRPSSAAASYTRRVVWIRYNPDPFRVDGIATPKYTQTEKQALLLATMESAAEALIKSESAYSIVYINYDLVTVGTGGDSILTPAIFHDPDYPADMKEVASSASLYTRG